MTHQAYGCGFNGWRFFEEGAVEAMRVKHHTRTVGIMCYVVHATSRLTIGAACQVHPAKGLGEGEV